MHLQEIYKIYSTNVMNCVWKGKRPLKFIMENLERLNLCMIALNDFLNPGFIGLIISHILENNYLGIELRI